MSLAKYKAKRNFKETPEPTGGKAENGKLRFVVQKHDATRLHYDFRLEMEGVLKSWAVPKGPSTDPSVKRLAVMVEDHPYDYRNFEGIIPSGYGAGTVMVWDEGFYGSPKATASDKATQEKELLKELKRGLLEVTLYGKKLKGKFALVKSAHHGENNWLMFKMKDEYDSEKDITLQDKSVVSKKTLAQIEKKPSKIYKTNRKTKEKTPVKKTPATKIAATKKTQNKTTTKTGVTKKKILNAPDETAPTEKIVIPASAKKAAFPTKLKPMLATLVDKPFDREGWIYEVKWDGYRAVAFLKKNKVELKSRNDKSFNEKFYPVTQALEKLNLNAVVDGEIVVLGENGISDFGSLQNWRSEADGELYYYLFDILWLDGRDLTELPLTERQKILSGLIPEEGILRLSESFDHSGTEFFESAKKIGLEGIMAKKADSTYMPGERSDEWLKIKANKRQEMVIGGYTMNDNTSKAFSSLLVGVFDEGKLRYTGKIGTGFSDKTQKEMLKQFKPLVTKATPFVDVPDINKPSRFRPDPPHATAVWLKPELVCEVSFTEMTRDGVMRHPSFEGMRIDKKAKNVVMEKAKPTIVAVKKADTENKTSSTKKAGTSKKTASGKEISLVTPTGKAQRKTLLNPGEETQVKKINGHDLKFTNLSKLYWPKDKITKRDMLNYYYQVAPYILPYLKDRPQSMNRHPNGINGPSFYFKDITGKAPDWLETFLYHSEADGRDRKYLVATDEASLLYMASLGCIEMNPWHSRVKTEDYPDWCIIDLDPGKNTFDQVIEAAQVTRQVLEGMDIISYPKTSGSTGIHIYIPLGAKYTYDQSKEFARVVARMVSEQLPAFTTIERVVKARKGKMYIDFLQNRPQATVSAPYSLRPKPGATVSMPLHWEEVKKGLKMTDFTIHNALARIKSEGDLFKPVLGKGVNLAKMIKKFSETP